MSAGHTALRDLATDLLDHLVSVRSVSNPTRREDMLMSTNTHLAAALDKVLTLASGLQSENAELKTELDAAKAREGSGITETDAEAMITKIEALTGPVSDPDGAPVDPPAGADPSTASITG